MHTSQDRPFQFRISHFAAVTAIVCLIAAIVAQFGWGLAVLALLLVLSIVASLLKRTRIAGIATCLILLAFACLFPAVSTPRWLLRQHSCQIQLSQIGRALHIYHDQWGCFPPAYVSDASGAPTHSWRTMILPQLDATAPYEQYDFAEPWNSAKNRPVADSPLREYGCPADENVGVHETNYVAVVGPGTAWPGETCTKLSEFEDGTANTILLVEVANAGIRWAEPRDLHIVQMAMFLNAVRGQGPSSNHKGGVHVLFANGSVRLLPEETSSEDLRAMLTITGGEKGIDFQPPDP